MTKGLDAPDGASNPPASRPAPPVPGAVERPAIFLYVAFAALSAAICSQINVRLGVTPNTAVVGVIVAIAVGRSVLTTFRSPERQVMVETATSAGGFAGANIALVSLATLYLLGLERLVVPLVAGISLGMVIDIWLAYRLFGTHAFPADGPWPDGEAVGRLIQAGDEGGQLGRELLQGVVAGGVGRFFSIPGAGIGIAFIGNPVALAALAAGLLARAHGPALGYDFGATYVPHGIMIGAGLTQVVQTAWIVWRARSARAADGGDTAVPRPEAGAGATVDAFAAHELGAHFVAFAGGAIVLALVAGLWPGHMDARQLALWIGFAGAAAFLHTIVVGYCAMLSGWFPSFAVAIALILVAALLRFPATAVAMLAGYVMSTGPQFADLGYDLKSGWIIRGRGTDPAREAAGRRQQARLQQIGGLVGIVTAALATGPYFRAGLVPPMSRVVAATVGLTMTPALPAQLALGAAFGAVAQIAGGPSRAVGLLLATGLLLDNPSYGYALAAALLVRAWIGTKPMTIRAPGLIAGDGLAGFVESVLRTFV